MKIFPSKVSRIGLSKKLAAFLALALNFPAMPDPQDTHKIVESVEIEGNRKINDKAISSKLYFKQGDTLETCKQKSSMSLKKVAQMGYFRDESIKLRALPGSSSDKVKLVLELEEKKLISGYEFVGNSAVTAKKLRTSLNMDSVVAIDADDVERMCRQIERVYRKENYLAAKATGTLELDGPESFKVTFTVDEGPQTRVLKVNFVGCKNIPERKLRASLFTREDWLLSPLDSAGKYDKDMIERDKRVVENFYQDQGYLNASVPEVKVKRADNGKDVEVTFYVEEGNLYHVSRVGLPYDNEFNALDIEKAVTVREEEPYSLSDVRDSVTRLEYVFGEGGYIYLNAYPEVIPDHKNHKVEVNFKVDKGDRYFVNEIEITGNKLTRDFVIRRELLVQEGKLATKSMMDRSRDRVEYLDYFERGSVDWKIHKVDDGKVNLELVVKEKRSGQASMTLNYGPNSGGKTAPALVLDVHKRNLMGVGWDAGAGLHIGDGAVKLAFMDFENPYLFDKDLNFGTRAYASKVDFDYLDPVEETIGALSTVGFTARPMGQRVRCIGELGFESVNYKIPEGKVATKDGKVMIDLASLALSDNSVFKSYKKDLFTGGDYAWVGSRVTWDRLNYRVNPTKGWNLELRNKFAFSGFGGAPNKVVEGHSMAKLELEGSFFWPLIEADDRLIFSTKAKLGFAEPLGDPGKKPLIHKELFKIGGIHSMRGFRWGEAGPMFKIDQDASPTPIGAKRMFTTNVELTTPLGTGPGAPHAFLFYDVGCGWNAQKINLSMAEQEKHIVNDRLDLRHAVGFGVKFSMPYPIRIDWGYKLDRRGGESPSELNISMNVPF